MKEFTERHHAFLSAMYYKLMKEENFHSFQQVFIKATSTYAMQRGHRMALRALRDGRELNYASYRYYGEWEYSKQSKEEAKKLGKPDMEAWVTDGNLNMKIHYCPWSAQYLEMGLEDGAEDYCKDLDIAIVRGFNPALTYQVNKVMHKNKDFCLHCQQNACMGGEKIYGDKDEKNCKDFGYHCGHLYKTFSTIMVSVYGSNGALLNGKVIKAFSQQYGEDMARVVLSYLDTDFEAID